MRGRPSAPRRNCDNARTRRTAQDLHRHRVLLRPVDDGFAPTVDTASDEGHADSWVAGRGLPSLEDTILPSRRCNCRFGRTVAIRDGPRRPVEADRSRVRTAARRGRLKYATVIEEEAMSGVVPTRRLLTAISVIAMASAACSSAQGSPGPAVSSPSRAEAAGTPATVAVNLQEWAVLPSIGSVAAGSVTFHATNTGGIEHELVIIKTELSPHALPISGPGMVDEFAAGMEVIDGVEALPAGEQATVTVTMGAGKYVLVCNIATDIGGHYKLGMATAFTVTD